MQPPAALSVFRHRPYARYALCRFSASLAWQMFAVGVGWQVYALTKDPLALGFVGLAEFLPFVCLVLVGGYVADHVDRRKILLAMWTMDMLGLTSVCVITLAQVRLVWPIYLAIAVFGTTRSFWQPSLQALVPNLVPMEEFPRALSVNSMLFQTAAILGPALGGLLFLLGPEVVFGACAGLFLLIIIVGSGLPPQLAGQPLIGGATAPSTDKRFLDGLRYVLHHRTVLGVISLDLFAVLFGGVGLFGVCTLIFGDSRSFALSLAALCVLGVGDMLSVYIRGILVQLRTPDAIRGRVSAISSMFIGASNELGEFESGLTARWFGAVRAVLLGGVLTLGVVGSWMGLFPELRKLDRLR